MRAHPKRASKYSRFLHRWQTPSTIRTTPRPRPARLSIDIAIYQAIYQLKKLTSSHSSLVASYDLVANTIAPSAM